MTVAANAAESNQIAFQSSEQRTALLELYTSEGCSSCPPAETWLSRLTDSPQLWRDFVPVAFHVDYWDHLGWRDPWGASKFSARQRTYAAEWRTDSIYTPEFVLNGREWRDWASRKDVPKFSSPIVGVISVRSTDTNNWQVSFAPANRNRTAYEAHACWLASNASSAVKAGENRGRQLKHDFVALSFTEAPMQRQDDGFECKLRLPIPSNDKSVRLGIAVWITKSGKLEPVQATGRWLIGPSVHP